MNILVLGSGGREHAISWKIKQSQKCENLYVAPGNAGTAQIAENVDVNIKDFEAVKYLVLDKQIELVVVGPEEPLVLGIVDFFKSDEDLKSIKIVGPDKVGAQLEGSKDFAKDFMFKYDIPTAKSKTFTKDTFDEGIDFLENTEGPYVLKADGLAAGKGVIITSDREEAQNTLRDMLLDAKFGDASSKVVIEEFLSGIELSVFILMDGENYVMLPEAKDYKRIGEGDTGPNTGGMGAVSPVVIADKQFMRKVKTQVVERTVEGLKAEGIKYTGFIFFGLINVDDNPYVIEYNVRMGDPETEVVMPRIKSDFVELLDAAGTGDLGDKKIEFHPYYCSTVMAVSGGYPGSYEKGKVINGLNKLDGIIPFHAGTKLSGSEVVTNGGRVIAFSALGKNIGEALTKSYKALENVEWDGIYYRKDIGKDLLRLSL